MILLPELQEQIKAWLVGTSNQISIEVNSMSGFSFLEVRKDEVLQLAIYCQMLTCNSPLAEPIGVPPQVIRQIFELRHSGISAIVLWEDSWVKKMEIVKSRILSILGYLHRIPGRLTKVRRIDKSTAISFLESNHLQAAVSSKIQYGLYLPKSYFRILEGRIGFDTSAEELLVGVATFAGGRVFAIGDATYRSFEMIRFCNVLNCVVVGGLNKLLASFCKDFHPGDVMTYADLEWSDGVSYEKLGFEKINFKAPIPFWLDCENLLRYRFEVDRQRANVQSWRLVENMGSLKFVKSYLVEQEMRQD